MTSRLPYLNLPGVVLVPEGTFFDGSGPLVLHPFGMFVAGGVVLGVWLSRRQATRQGLDDRKMTSFLLWLGAVGFLMAHLFDVVLYAPERIADEPWLLVKLWDGLSSFGGFLGAVLGALLWKVQAKTPFLSYADAVATSFPAGWILGRAGCSVVHDHPGVASDAWLALAFPGGARLDLGFLEMLLTVPLALGFVFLRRQRLPQGLCLGLLAATYAPLRFTLDFWRIREPTRLSGELVLPDPRYAGLTPAQWASLVLGAVGAVLLSRARSGARMVSDPETNRARQDPR